MARLGENKGLSLADFRAMKPCRHCRVDGQEALKPLSDVDAPEDRCGQGWARPIPT